MSENLLTAHRSRFEFSLEILVRVSPAAEESPIDW